MKIILRKIESYENKKFSQTLKQHKDYTRVLLEITKKILSNNDCVNIDEESLFSQSYLKLVIEFLFIFLLISFILWGIHVKWRLIYLQKR